MTELGPERLSREYRIGPELRSVWLETFGKPFAAGHDAPRGSTDRMWAEFSLTANLRGEGVALTLARLLTRGWPTLAGRRTLDVGCGIGGVAVGCARLGADAWGIDVDSQLLTLAQANAADQPNPPRLDKADLLEEGLADRLGRFHGVSAEDVLEHVADAEEGVSVLADLVEDGGVAVVTIPNGDALALVRADGHYALPGITLLRNRPDAAAYHGVRFPHQDYDVGNYHSFDEYAGWIGEAGFRIIAVDHIGESSFADLDADLAAARQVVMAAAGDASLPGAVQTGIAAGWDQYLARVEESRAGGEAHATRRLCAHAWRFRLARGTTDTRWAWRGPGLTWQAGLREIARAVPGAPRLARAVRGLRRR